MEQVTFRLKSGDLLKETIERVVQENYIEAGGMLSMVGSLDVAVLRMADATSDSRPVKQWRESMEIVSATGTVSIEGCHVHVSISDKNGIVYGGHLSDGCVVKTTVEVIILVFHNSKFKRIFDQGTGFKELVVE